MKTVVLVAALLALCSGHNIPPDNSHYVEGESGYEWMPDAEGLNVLADFEEPVDEELLNARNGAINQYLLYTRRNPQNPQFLVHGNLGSLLNSNFNPSLNVNVFVHGWTSNEDAQLNSRLPPAFLAHRDCNVIVVDWRTLANSNYNTAAAGVPGVGQQLGIFLNWLIIASAGNWNQVHLVGFDLGAHVVGIAGRQTNGRIARITGLNPAGPGWYNDPNRLSPNSGQYVEAIHTDRFLGIFIRSGDADFYVNNGNSQPGCLSHVCSHNSALRAFTLSISRIILGKECDNSLKMLFRSCNGAEFPLGNDDVNKRGSGVYSASLRVYFLRPDEIER